MANEGFKRKLTAILSADAVGYSRLMGENEETTVRTITAYREVLSTLIQQHNGNVIDSPGDNLLAEFASVVDAVQCGVAVQKEIKARNDELPENRRMQFRIGINLGDVIQEENRIYGDGVNVAARLEGLADPGGICISKTAFDHIESKLPYGYEFLGDQTVKNIVKPVGAYRVMMEPRITAAGEPKDEQPASMRRMPILVGAVAIVALSIAVGVWYFHTRPTQPLEEAASIEKMAYPLPDKPSFAVLPFVNVSNDPDLEYFCDGITETTISTLSQSPFVFVIASNSSFTYKGKPVKVNKVAEELGVQYVVEGSVQKSGDRVRIAVQLIDALTGRHIWSERYDRNLKDLFKLQDEIAFEILKSTQIDDALIGKVKNWFARGGTNSIDAHLIFLEAMYNYHHHTENHLIKAKQLFEEATAIDPNFALAHTMLSYTYQFLGRYYSSGETSRINLEKGLELAEKAIEIDNSVSDAHAALGYYYLTQRKFDITLAEYKKAIELDSANCWNHSSIAGGYFWLYRLEEAVYHQKEAIRLNPLQPFFHLDLGRQYFHLRRYEDAIKIYDKVFDLMKKVPLNPRWPHVHLAMIYSELGRYEEARTHMKKVLEYYPKFNLEDRRIAITFMDPANTEREIEALRKAGAPEHPPSN
ncbi:Adenylate cyclase (EC [Olavius algarvensis Delta 1 endosymbiont]|nr:Adenylate cyclase (EC [Olavius algarvensis Delta 1 endosymbiont]